MWALRQHRCISNDEPMASPLIVRTLSRIWRTIAQRPYRDLPFIITANAPRDPGFNYVSRSSATRTRRGRLGPWAKTPSRATSHFDYMPCGRMADPCDCKRFRRREEKCRRWINSSHALPNSCNRNGQEVPVAQARLGVGAPTLSKSSHRGVQSPNAAKRMRERVFA